MEQQQMNEKKSLESASAIQEFTFIKEEGRWYIHLPELLLRGWSREDLEMVDGADKLLNILSRGKGKVRLKMSTEHFDGAAVLELMEICEAPKGGAVYLLENRSRPEVSTFLWVCDIALFVFGDLPQNIYVQRVPERKSTE